MTLVAFVQHGTDTGKSHGGRSFRGSAVLRDDGYKMGAIHGATLEKSRLLANNNQASVYPTAVMQSEAT